MLLNRNGTAPPMSMPMKTSGLATESIAGVAVEVGGRQLADSLFAALHEHGNEAREQRDGGDHGRADGDALGDRLGRVAGGIEIGQDLPGRCDFRFGDVIRLAGARRDGYPDRG